MKNGDTRSQTRDTDADDQWRCCWSADFTHFDSTSMMHCGLRHLLWFQPIWIYEVLKSHLRTFSESCRGILEAITSLVHTYFSFMSFPTFWTSTVSFYGISHHFRSFPMRAGTHVHLYPRWLEFIWLDIQHNQTGIDVGTITRPWWIWATEYCNVILHTTTLSSIWSRSYQRTGYACMSSGRPT